MKKKSFILLGMLFMVAFSFGQTGNFITKWEDNQSGNFIVHIPINPDQSLTYNYTIDWGDGSPVQTFTNVDAKHDYTQVNGGSTQTSYQIEISGTFPAIFMKNSSTPENLVDIEEWGSNIQWLSMAFAFEGCKNLGLINSIDDPDLSNLVDMSYMFHNCSKMNGNMNGWDVSSVENMRGVFSGASSFTSQLGEWDVNNVEDMTAMFENAIVFNRELNWETSALKHLSFMFSGAKKFNKSLNSFNVSEVRNFDGMFQNAVAFNQDLSEWEFSPISTQNMFSGAKSFNQHLSFCDMSGNRNMSHMFQGADAFDQNLGLWNISAVETMENMLSASNLSSCNYESTLSGWSSNAPNNIILGADGLVYYDDSGRSSLVNNGWEIKGDIKNRIDECALNSNICGLGRSTFFITEWNLGIPSTGNVVNRTIEIPVNNLTYKYDVDWENDGVFDVLDVTGSVQHTYPGTNQVYEVAIRQSLSSGAFPTIVFWNSQYAPKLTSIVQWGCIEWESFNRSFESCINLEYRATDAPDLSANNSFSMSNMFKNAPLFNGDLNNWDVSNVKYMNGMFEGASVFNGNISSWDVTNVETISRMFLEAEDFNSDISNWNITNKISSLNSTFMKARSFNRDISGWDVSNVTTLHHTFHEADTFNQNLSAWDVSKVKSMYGTFYGAQNYDNGGASLDWSTDSLLNMNHTFRATPFNKPMPNWDASLVNSMSHTFALNDQFNQNIGSWAVDSVTSFYRMFYHADSFDQDLSWNINTNAATPVNMVGMFESAVSFDGNISSWNVSNVQFMDLMFNNANLFNQDLSSWNVSNVETMSRMFSYANSFNQNLSTWNLTSITAPTLVNGNLVGSLIHMLDNCGMTRVKYDSTLIGWAFNSNTPSGLILGAVGRNYCDAATVISPNTVSALDQLTLSGNLNWTINGHNLNCLAFKKASNTNKTGDSIVQMELGTIRVSLKETNSSNQIIRVNLYSTSGQLILSELPLSLNMVELNKNLSKGIYLLQIETTEGIESKKILIP